MKAAVVFLSALAQAGGAHMPLDPLVHKIAKLADGYPQWTGVSADDCADITDQVESKQDLSNYDQHLIESLILQRLW